MGIEATRRPPKDAVAPPPPSGPPDAKKTQLVDGLIRFLDLHPHSKRAFLEEVSNGLGISLGGNSMSTRSIYVGDWNAQGLLPVEIADRTEEDSNVKLFRLTPEESRELERKLHEANAEMDE